jgi:DNA-binding CsgD family transcriptional regulator
MGGHMEANAEFHLQGALCRVVQEDRAEGLASGEGVQRGEVVGTCHLDGRRYLILRSSQAPSPKAADVLTERELQVAIMVGQGLGNKRIAMRLGLSEWTVNAYLRRAFAKLGVRTRAAMVARILGDLTP